MFLKKTKWRERLLARSELRPARRGPRPVRGDVARVAPPAPFVVTAHTYSSSRARCLCLRGQSGGGRSRAQAEARSRSVLLRWRRASFWGKPGTPKPGRKNGNRGRQVGVAGRTLRGRSQEGLQSPERPRACISPALSEWMTNQWMNRRMRQGAPLHLSFHPHGSWLGPGHVGGARSMLS